MVATDRLPGIHALRVVAAVSVFLLHILNLTAAFVAPVQQAASQIHFGVPLFFAVSAFSLMYSTRPTGTASEWVSRFYIKRYFRIAPLYYVMLVFEVLLQHAMSLGVWFAVKPLPDWYSVLLNVTFTFSLSPEHSPGLVLIGWSVGAEMLFYLMFPLFLVLIRTVWSAVLFVVVSQVIGEIARPMLDPLASFPFFVRLSDMHILTNLRYFAFGMLAFLIFDRLRATRLGAKDAGAAIATGFHAICSALSAGLVAVLIVYGENLKALWHLDMAVWGALFTVMCVWLTVRPISFLNWAPIQYLGERSYSLYLIHYPAILLMAPFTAAVFYGLQPAMGAWALVPAVAGTYIPIIVLSAIAYRLIERPGMDFGRFLIRRARDNRQREAA